MTSKPEDLVSGVMLFLLLLTLMITVMRINRETQTAKLLALCFGYIFYLIIVTVAYGGNIFYVFRYILYYSMILVAFLPGEKPYIDSIERVAFLVLIVYFGVSLLQKLRIVGGIHTGQYVSDVSDRATLIFTNSTEAGLISGMLFAIVIGSRQGRFIKITAFVCAVAVNFLGQNRIALASLFLIAFVFVVKKKQILVSFRRFRLRITRKALLILFLLIFILSVATLSVYMPRAFVVSEEISLGKVLKLSSRLIQDQFERQEVPSDISEYAIGRSSSDYGLLDESWIFRIQKWTYVMKILSSGYVFGIGAGNSIGDAVDGFYFRLLVESGYLGLFIYFLIFRRLYGIARIKKGGIPGLAYVLLILLVQGTFLDSFYFSRVGYLFWLLVGFKLHAMRENHEIENYTFAPQLGQFHGAIGPAVDRDA